MSAFLRKYAIGSGADVLVPMVKRGVADFAVGADWTPAAGDVKVSIDGGAAANIGTLPTAIAMGNTTYWKFVLTNGEITGKRIVVTVADSATKVVEDQMFVIETYGNASAMHPFDLATAGVTVAAIATGAITAASIATDAIDADALATDALDEVVARLKPLNGTLASTTTSTATFGSWATATVDDFYVGWVMLVYENAGAGQYKPITAYNHTTKVASFGDDWAVPIDATSKVFLLQVG